MKNTVVIDSTDNTIAIEYFCDLLFNKKERIVTIWGAGASIGSGIPSGYYIMQRMAKDIEKIKNSCFFKEQLGLSYDDVKSNLESGSNLTFEYVLWIYSKVYGLEKLHLWLKQYIPVLNEKNQLPYFPSFSHEYFSHLVKSGYFKYIISTNFDEILENTLENELGYGNFKIIASKSEFERLVNLDINNWESDYRAPLTRCFVFKPHGTISRRLTLRHTKDNVTHFEDEKREVLKKVLNESVIVFIGFGNYNENFWLLFGETYSMGLTKDILIIDKNVKQVKGNLPDERLDNKIYKFNGTINEFFKGIFNIQDKYKNVTKQLPNRHYIRSLFFDLFSQNRKLAELEDEPAYRDTIIHLKNLTNGWWFDLRIYELELLIYLFKSRGLFIQLAASECPRIVTCYLKCLKWKNELIKSDFKNELTSIDLEPTAILKQMLNREGDDPLIAIGNVVDRFNKNALNIYWCFLVLNNKLHTIFRRKIENDELNLEIALKDVFIIYCQEIVESYINHLYNKIVIIDSAGANTILNENTKQQFSSELKNQFIELYRGFDIDIVEKDVSTRMRFKLPKPITSRNDLVNATNRLLLLEGDTLRISTISAEWLTKKIERFNEDKLSLEFKKMTIISNLSMFKNYNYLNIETKNFNVFHFQQMIYNISKLIKSIKEWKTNTTIEWYAIQNLQHHMTIISKGNKNLMATYFRREGKNAEISPVLIDNEYDLNNLSNYFNERINSLNSSANSYILHGGLLFKVIKNENSIEIIFNNSTNVLEIDEYTNFKTLLEYLFKNEPDIVIKENVA